MYVGETIQISVTDTRPAAFTASDGTLVVLQPDGTNPGSQPAVTISPGTSAIEQTLSAHITPPIGGSYGLTWQYQDGDGETIIRKGERFASWSNAEGLARNRLRDAASLMSQYDFEREFALVARSVLSRWPQIGNGIGTSATMGVYNLVSGYDDQCFLDEAIALVVCSRLIGPLTTQGAASDLSVVREGNEERRFSDDGRGRPSQDSTPGDAGAGPGGYAGPNERERWIREAAEKIGRVSFVQQTIGGRMSWSPFRVWGPTSNAGRRGEVQTMLSDVIRLLSDRYDLEPAVDWMEWA